LFTYLHLAASKDCTKAIVDSGTTAIAYETVQLANRALPLLQPMSEVAGRLSAQIGAFQLMKTQGGFGILMGGVPGTPKAKVVIIGGGVAGTLGEEGEVSDVGTDEGDCYSSEAAYRFFHSETALADAWADIDRHACSFAGLETVEMQYQNGWECLNVQLFLCQSH
jgi:hypothetical protein